MDSLTLIPRADFLALANRTNFDFRAHRRKGQFPLWHEAPSRPITSRLRFCVFDALVFRTAWCLVSLGARWDGIALAMPGLQATLGRALDRGEPTLAGVSVIDERKFVVGAGTVAELTADGVINAANPGLFMPVDVVVAHFRRRAAEHGIVLPRRLAPPVSALPAWVDRDAALGKTQSHGVLVRWSETTAGQFAVATLN